MPAPDGVRLRGAAWGEAQEFEEGCTLFLPHLNCTILLHFIGVYIVNIKRILFKI